MPDAGAAAEDSLAPRILPRQRRARERRRAILDAALALLETNSLETLSTSLIAQAAGIPVASVYAYFPNKWSVVAELAREAMEEVDGRIASMLPAEITQAGIAAAVDRTIDVVLAGYRAVPARLRLFSSIRGNDTLVHVLRESDARMAGLLAERLAQARPDLPVPRIRAVAQTVVATFTAMQDQVLPCEDKVMFDALVAEWRRIVTGYLTGLLA